MRRIALAAALVLVFVFSACRDAGGVQAGVPSGRAAPRCGGVRAGFDYVVAGHESPFFTARSSQRIFFPPGTKVELGLGKEPTTIVVARDNNGPTIECSCPGGCSGGCVIVFEPGTPGAGAVCSGDCASESSCCSGCAFWTRWP